MRPPAGQPEASRARPAVAAPAARDGDGMVPRRRGAILAEGARHDQPVAGARPPRLEPGFRGAPAPSPEGRLADHGEPG